MQMRLLRSAVLIASALPISSYTNCYAEPQTTENSRGRTVSVSHLDDGDARNAMCGKDTLSGKVVARKFNEIGIELTGFTVEYEDGTRDFINVSVPKDLNMALLGRVTQGLQSLIKIGRRVSGRTYRCGAAGRVLMLDEIR